jgi:hypothetical protein
MACGGVAGDLGNARGAAAALSEDTQIVRVRQIPIRPFQRDPLQIISSSQAEQGIAAARNAADEAADANARQAAINAGRQLLNDMESSGQAAPHNYNPYGFGR